MNTILTRLNSATIAAAALLLAGCAATPTTIVQEPTTVRQRPPMAAAPQNGAIFQAAAYRPLFEDRRARMVGDILTINITENTSAVKSGATSNSKTGSVSFEPTKLLGMPSVTSSKFGIDATSGNKFEDKAAASASNSFTGTIGVTVIDVLPNGYLIVSGEKQIAFDKGAEYVRFSGTVNPDAIQSGNVVASTAVADARLEYRTNTRLDKSEMLSVLNRFFLSILPL